MVYGQNNFFISVQQSLSVSLTRILFAEQESFRLFLHDATELDPDITSLFKGVYEISDYGLTMIITKKQ